MAGAKATMMVAGAAASFGLAFASDRRLAPAFVGVAPAPEPVVVAPTGAAAVRQQTARGYIARHILLALLIGAGIVALAASLPAFTALASSLRESSAPAPAFGPALNERAAAGVAGNWEQSYSVASVPAAQVGGALVAEGQRQQALKALQAIADARAAEATASRPVAVPAPYSVNSASGFEPGTVLHARITIYGCTGPGGGFCNHMASGGTAFEGAAACSYNLPFGTKLTIAGDPTGRVYECLDRGALANTWVDVYFEDTRDGMAWQSLLGGTVADITIVN